ncbi:ABC transporter B family member 19-like [Selaginella moellendorffii]|uniref:ABC transporter B family member 19-like n=1 Tax=Selaginella moellendorffii TaxID=88036 RepID=UPI000D1CF3D7|nr:ABC transporter B family member 19-like [Selaginella moellendorffii]XP_024530786.1 ABC transporter B family member 19-like [Selaginella moellendorffii]|eukprot:XP_024530785.1 ABC transporter B family member 19-like [Selaginella moellendorffii]
MQEDQDRRHDISFFDGADARTGELVSSISSNTLVIQQAISEKLGLLRLAAVPVVILAGGLYAHVITGVSSRSQKEHQQFLKFGESVRSLASKQRSVCTPLLSVLRYVRDRAGRAKGIGMGAMCTLPLCSWALLMWYGGILVRNGTTSALSTIFCVLLGAFAKL